MPTMTPLIRPAIILALNLSSVFAQDSTVVRASEFGSPQYLAVMVENVTTSAQWYGSVFGLREVGGSNAADGSWEIENLRNDHLAVEIIRDDRAKKVDRALGFRKVGFRVPNVETIADRVMALTKTRPRIIDVERFGIRLIQLRDPDGNIIQLESPLEIQK